MESGNRLVRKTFYGMLIVNVISMVSGIMCVMIDAIVTGQFLGTEAVTAAGLINPVLMLSNVLGALLGPGVSVVCTRYLGMAKPKRVNEVFSLVVITQLIVFGLISALIFASAPAIAHALGGGSGSERITDMMTEYLHGFAFAVPPMCINLGLSGLMIMDNDRRRGIAAMMVTLIGDLIFDLANALIFRGGMLGMALATALSHFAGLAVVLTHFLKKDRVLRFTRQGLRIGDLKEVMLCGVPSALTLGCQALRTICFNMVLLAVAGAGAVAALSVSVSAFSVFLGVALGVFVTTGTLCSLLYGEEDRNGLVEALTVALRTVLLCFAVLTVLMLAFARQIAGFFLDAAAAEELAQGARFIRFTALQFLLNAASFPLSGAYQGTRQLKRNYGIDLMREGGFPVICCVSLALLFGIRGFEFGLSLAGALTLLLCVMIPRLALGRFTLDPARLLLLPASFGARPEELFEASMQTMDDVMETSARVAAFCESKGAPRRTGTVTSLFVEEMAGNTVQHGFREGRAGSIDLRLIYGEDAKIIRLRDNGRPFDPLDWLERNHPEDPLSGAGIRILVGMAKDVRYIPALGLNNLVIRL